MIVKGSAPLTEYRFNTGTARHGFCRHCGINTHHQRRSNPSEVGINAGCLEGADLQGPIPIPWTDGRNHPRNQ